MDEEGGEFGFDGDLVAGGREGVEEEDDWWVECDSRRCCGGGLKGDFEGVGSRGEGGRGGKEWHGWC